MFINVRKYNIVMEGQETQSLTHTYLLLDTIKRMRDANADDQIDRYYKQCRFGLELIISYLSPEIRKDIDTDFKTLRAEIERINNDSSLNEESKKNEILKLKNSFADSHEYYIMASLGKVGIITVSEEGLIDFSSTDLERVKRIVRDSDGLDKAVEKTNNKE